MNAVTAKDTKRCCGGRARAKEKRPRRNAAFWNLFDILGVAKNYLGCGVDAGAAGLGAAGFKGAGLAAAPVAGAGAAMPDCVLYASTTALVMSPCSPYQSMGLCGHGFDVSTIMAKPFSCACLTITGAIFCRMR